MKSSYKICFYLLLAFIVFSFTFSIPVYAQSQTLYWQRLDSDITIQPNGDVRVQEIWEVVFTSGQFHFGFRDIDVSKLDSVSNVSVTEGNRAFASSRSQSEYTFETYNENGKFYIKWFFPYTSNSTHTYIIAYTVKGIVRIYDGGDQVWWYAVFPEHPYPVRNAKVTVRLPANFDTAQIKAAITTGTGTTQVVNGQTAAFSAQNIPTEKPLEIRVQFPHGTVTSAAPSWQWREDNKQIFNLAFLFIGFVTLLVGPLFLYLLWFIKGRDASAEVVAQTSAPPDDLPPGVVGTLLDESADMQDIVATIVDLSRRGVMKLTEKDSPGLLGIGTTRDFTFELIGDASKLRKYEQTLLDEIFSHKKHRDLSDLKEKFYTAIPTLKDQMYDETLKLGFFAGNPQTTRRIWMGLGIAALVIAGIVGFIILALFSDLADTAICPGIALGVGAIGLLILSPFMPRRTPKGATERAKWTAFKRYLESIEKFTKLDQAKDLFDKYLPYAISFGLEKSWVQKFAEVGTPAPTWYETFPPLYDGYPRDYRRGSRTPETSTSGGGSGGGTPSLDRAAGNVFTGLDSMSTGLFSMLDSTASVLSSAPASSSSGGGGWSGGGGGGGGGGGSGGGGGGFG